MSNAFVLDETPTSEVDRREEACVPLTEALRDLVDAAIRSTVDDDEIRAVHAEVEGLVERLRVRQLDGPAGVRFNSEGRAWNWGNAVVGKRNAIAPPLEIVHDPSGVVHADVDLGAAYEGPPGLVHGGVAALLLDQVMGETASAMKRVAMTGTLTMRYRRATALGPVRVEARIDREDGRKIHVVATISDAEGPTVEAEGVFIVPRWAMPDGD